MVDGLIGALHAEARPEQIDKGGVFGLLVEVDLDALGVELGLLLPPRENLLLHPLLPELLLLPLILPVIPVHLAGGVHIHTVGDCHVLVVAVVALHSLGELGIVQLCGVHAVMTGQNLQHGLHGLHGLGCALAIIDPLGDDALDNLVDLGISDDVIHGHTLGDLPAGRCCTFGGVSFLGCCGSGGLLRGFLHPGTILAHVLGYGGTRPSGNAALGNSQLQKLLLPGGGSRNARGGCALSPGSSPAVTGGCALGKELEVQSVVFFKHGASSCMI